MARMHALHILDGLYALTDDHIASGLKDSDPHVRVHALILSEKISVPTDILISLANDPDMDVRYQLAFTFGGIDDPLAASALTKIIRRDINSSWMQAAVPAR